MPKITRKEGLMKSHVFSILLPVGSTGRAKHNNGLAAKSKGQWKDAENYFKLGCYTEKVDSSCKELGRLYEFGKGSDVKKDSGRAKQAYEKCCEISFGKRADCCDKAKDKTAVSAKKRLRKQRCGGLHRLRL